MEKQHRQLHLPLEAGLGREAQAALLRVRLGPECPEGYLRELTWTSKPECEIATEIATTQKALT